MSIELSPEFTSSKDRKFARLQAHLRGLRVFILMVILSVIRCALHTIELFQPLKTLIPLGILNASLFAVDCYLFYLFNYLWSFLVNEGSRKIEPVPARPLEHLST